MKLGKLGIFLILLLSLLFAGLGFSTYELMSNRREGYDNGDSKGTPTSLAISEDQPPPNNSKTSATSTAIPVEDNSQPQDSSSTPQDSSPEDSSSTPQDSGSDNDSSPQSVDDQYILKTEFH